VSPDTEQAIRMLDLFGARYSPRRLNASKTLSSGLAVRWCRSTTSLTLGPVLPHTGPVTAKLRVLATGLRPLGS
jgi:hypothetical protein